MINKDVFYAMTFSEALKLSEDIPFFAQVIVNFDCLYLDLILTKMYKHDQSMRHDIDRLLSSSYKSVDVLFDEQVLPTHFFKYRDMFKAKRALSLFRSLRLQGEVEKAKSYYWEAIKLQPAFLFNLSYLKKYLLSSFCGK